MLIDTDNSYGVSSPVFIKKKKKKKKKKYHWSVIG